MPPPLAPAPIVAQSTPDDDGPQQCPALEVPSGWTNSGTICDLPDRIIIANWTVGKPKIAPRESVAPITGTVTVIARPSGKRDRAPIANGSSSIDNCGGEGGGHAGCSESGGEEIRSRALGANTLALGVGRNYRLTTPGSEVEQSCRDTSGPPWVATCSTANHFAVVHLVESGGCVTLELSLFAGTGESPLVTEAAAFEGTPHTRRVGAYPWTYRSERATLRFDAARGGATLDVGNASEPCLAVFHQ